jgi:GxxExxY protein
MNADENGPAAPDHLRQSASSAVHNVSELRDPQTYAIIGAAMEVHRELGSGFLEGVYQDAMYLELLSRSVPCIREHPIPIHYKGALLGTPYHADFLCFGAVLVELKALKALSSVEDAQVLHYLKATRLQRAVLLNFGAQRLEYKRLVNSHPPEE